MKKYIFLTSDIYRIGGIELYLFGKSKYLENNGWKVTVIYSRLTRGSCEISGLNKYIDGGVLEMSLPPKYWSFKRINRILEKIVNIIGEDSDEVIIESHTSSTSLWGDLVARRLNAQHFCFLCNETFDGKGKYYKEYIDFYNFKHIRKELLGINCNSLKLLFDGYKEVAEDECYSFSAMPADPIQDVIFDESCIRTDYNLCFCYIGRTAKDYFPNICDGVLKFALKNQEKRIQFIIVGEIGERQEMIEKIFSKVKNVTIMPLGNMVPIPRDLFKYIDIVLAGSGSALYSAYEGVPTIVADAKTNMANGLLGYDTTDYLYADNKAVVSDFCTAIERVLKEKPHTIKPFILDPKKSSDNYYREQEEYIYRNLREKDYYPIDKLSNNNNNYIAIIKLYTARAVIWIRSNLR